MKKAFLAAAAAVGALALASGAQAADITMAGAIANQLNTLDSGVILEDFDSVHSALTTFTGNTRGPFDDGFNVSDSAPPPFDDPSAIDVCCQGGVHYDGDPTKYASVQANGASSFPTVAGYSLTSFSFYMGSPDDYNHVVFHFLGGGTQSFNGPDIWGGPSFGGDRTKGFRVYYDFNGRRVTSIDFSTESTNAFEFDSLAGDVSVPEPATWAMMILGFGAAGAMLRRRTALA
jgi:hypothetical protein